MQLSIAPVYQIQRRAIRHEMKDRILAGLPKEALTVFRLTTAELEEVDFVDGGRELRQAGIMYDIVRVYGDAEGRVVIEAARDDKETRLMADLGRMVRQRASADEQGRQQRRCIVASWAPFCGSLDFPIVPVAPARDRFHGGDEPDVGGPIVPIDPGPPRSA